MFYWGEGRRHKLYCLSLLCVFIIANMLVVLFVVFVARAGALTLSYTEELNSNGSWHILLRERSHTHTVVCWLVALKMREEIAKISRKMQTGIAVLRKPFSEYFGYIYFSGEPANNISRKWHEICLNSRTVPRKDAFLLSVNSISSIFWPFFSK